MCTLSQMMFPRNNLRPHPSKGRPKCASSDDCMFVRSCIGKVVLRLPLFVGTAVEFAPLPSVCLLYVSGMVEMSSFSLHPAIRKARDSLAYVQEKEEATPTISSRSGGMKNFVAEIMSPFTACWQPDNAACVPQCGEDYQSSQFPAKQPTTPVAVVSPASDRTNRSPCDIPTSPVTSRYSSKLCSSPNKEEKEKTSEIEKPHSNDVLCGRGGSSNRHLGNTHFRELVAANKKIYVGLTKKQKMLVARKIVEMIHSTDPPGRFLSKDLDTGRWYDIGLPRSLEKTSQALREKNSNDYQSDQGTEVSDVLSDTSLPYSSSSPTDPVTVCSSEAVDEKSTACKASRNSSKNAEAPPLTIPPHLMRVFGPEKLRDSNRAWPDYSLSHSLEQPYLPTYHTPLAGAAPSPLSPPRDYYAPPPRHHPYDATMRSSHHYHGAPPPPPHYHRYGGHHPATPPPPDYRDHYEYYPHPDSRDHFGQHAPRRAPPPLSPGHYRAYPQPVPPIPGPPPRPYGQHAVPPIGQSMVPGHSRLPYHPHATQHFDYSHGHFIGSPAPPMTPPSAVLDKSPGNGTARSQAEVSPDRRQEWKRQRNETGTPRRLSSEASLSRAVQNSLSLEERVVGRERGNPAQPNGGAELMSPSGTLQGRSRPRGEEKRGLSSVAVASLTEKEGDAVSVLSGLAALSTAAFLKLDEND